MVMKTYWFITADDWLEAVSEELFAVSGTSEPEVNKGGWGSIPYKEHEASNKQCAQKLQTGSTMLIDDEDDN